LKAEAAAKKVAKEAQASLDKDTLNKYGDLTEGDIKALVLDDKWAMTLRNRIAGKANSLTLVLIGRIQELGERYVETAGALAAEMGRLEAKVAGHLADMGIK
jgi:type I restriction enzyme M protein